ncbi:MAG: hypothetical protein JXB26_11170 [Candidatus Aminicenantes bacterium]|nr:hypothetical protein [Candidatus Aminicenantes bacterium]
MKILYQIIVAYLTIHLVVVLFREKKIWGQVSTAIVLVLFLLRLFLIK